MKLPFSITPNALEEIQNIMKNKNIPTEYGLRVGIKGTSGCGGANFILGFDKLNEGDDHFIVEGVSIFIEKKHILFLAGKEIDFEDGPIERGFIFK